MRRPAAAVWDVATGSITIGGHDVRIRLGRADAPDVEVEAAARAAQAHQFIVELPHGYDNGRRELGARMSGGQQRIAIPRALLKDAPILVMDEAVSHLDATSEQAVTEVMNSARQGRTTGLLTARRPRRSRRRKSLCNLGGPVRVSLAWTSMRHRAERVREATRGGADACRRLRRALRGEVR